MSKSHRGLDKLSIDGCNYISDESSNIDVFHVHSPHALTQASGYLKYISGKDGHNIFFRGQTKLHKTLSPSLFRGISKDQERSRRLSLIKNACEEISSSAGIFSDIPVAAHEALLQHYGLRTSWVDLVDNIWVALWFACNQARSIGKEKQYLHFEQRDPIYDENKYAYILLISTDATMAVEGAPGCFKGEQTEVIDLRVAAPSVFIRPHAQHGVLFRAISKKRRLPVLNYYSQVAGIIRVDLGRALSWLGEGKMTGTHALFPPAYYDKGYGILLGCNITECDEIGSIAMIGT